MLFGVVDQLVRLSTSCSLRQRRVVAIADGRYGEGRGDVGRVCIEGGVLTCMSDRVGSAQGLALALRGLRVLRVLREDQ